MKKSKGTVKETVQVYKMHVDESVRGNVGHCMVANAIRDQLDVTGADISVAPGGGDWEVRLNSKVNAKISREVAKKIENWDSGINPEPFSVELELPADWRQRVRSAAR